MIGGVMMELAERYGRSVNASVLVMEESEEGALDCVTAAGWARRSIEAASTRGAARARLAGMLWRAKYGGDPKSVGPAIVLLSEVVSERLVRAGRDVMYARAIAARVMREWMIDRCPSCAGTGIQELVQGRRQRPSRHGAPGSRQLGCIACEATGIARPRADKRAMAMRMPFGQYVQQRWSQEFEWTAAEVRTIAQSFHGPLHKRLRGRNIRTQYVGAMS